jgi:flagellar hook-basal body complex protein FliE
VNGLNGITSAYARTIEQVQSMGQGTIQQGNTTDEAERFSGMIGEAITTLNNKQIDSHMAIETLIDGSSEDLHNVMIQTTEAQLSLEVAVQLRNRALEAYNEIKNIQF